MKHRILAVPAARQAEANGDALLHFGLAGSTFDSPCYSAETGELLYYCRALLVRPEMVPTLQHFHVASYPDALVSDPWDVAADPGYRAAFLASHGLVENQ
jgi:hypothetical protein